jgi:hypothetical protein
MATTNCGFPPKKPQIIIVSGAPFSYNFPVVFRRAKLPADKPFLEPEMTRH